MRCKSCSVKLDVKLDYCASCVGKGFDLRSFEVKRIARTKLIFDCRYTLQPIPIDNLSYVATLAQKYAHHLVNDKFNNSLTITITKDGQEYDWTFEDIKVGWFFKCSDGDLYWKHEDGEFRPMGSKCYHHKNCKEVDFGHFFVLGTNLNPDLDLKGLCITNVYDCQELAKALMIERIIT